MDTYEATQTVMSRIQALDPDNASKIMGYILIQDHGEKEMIRLAFSPDALLLSYINQAKSVLGISPIRSTNVFPQNSPRIVVPNNGFLSNPPSPAQRSSPRPISYAAALDGGGSPSLHFYGDEFPFSDELVVDNLVSPSGRSDSSLAFPYGEDSNSPHPFHRRSCSVNDALLLEERDGFMWRPCMYFSRGFCKNGTTCKFLHSDGSGGEAIDATGSPSNGSPRFDEMLRMKALQQQRIAFMAPGSHHPLTENLRLDLSSMELGGGANSSSRQIYLTFPADSTFKEEDVSKYFSIFGPVQDVRIPYQQKRMFGFVTFVYPETVKHILAKGNPHFLCDSRVLVKPYKEKGKLRDKKHQQHFERGDYSACSSPSGVDSRDNFDSSFGSRMALSPQEMMLRRKLEQQAEFQYALELQGRRLMNMQLLGMKNPSHNHPLPQNVAMGIPPSYSSPRQSQFMMNQHFATSDTVNHKDSKEFNSEHEAPAPTFPDATDEKLAANGSESSTESDVNSGNPKSDNTDLPSSFDHILPDNLFTATEIDQPVMRPSNHTPALTTPPP